MKHSKSIFCSTLLLLSPIAAVGQFVVSPNVAIPNPFNGAGSGPFLLVQGELPSIRYQEVHRSTDFLSVGTQPFLLTEISYWQSPGLSRIDVTLPNIEIRLSTTARQPDGLSRVFAENGGLNDLVVFSGPLHFFDDGSGPFGIHIRLQTPFFYDPNAGNLLIDVRNYQTLPGPIIPGFLYLQNATGDSTSIVSAGNVNSPIGGFGTSGLITRFAVTPVPEPSTWVLLVSVIAGLTYARWRQTR